MSTAMVVIKPHEPDFMAAQLTEKSAAFRALNQLLAISAGRMFARETDALKVDPSARIQRVIELTLGELGEAARNQSTDPSADKALAQANRKLDSLRSLALLARIIQQEVIWDED